MLYHIDDKEALLNNARDALGRSGRIVIDDWMLVNPGDTEARDDLSYHWFSSHFAVPRLLEEALERSRFRIVEVRDLGHIGRTYLARHVERQMWTYFAPIIAADFPDSVGDLGESGISGMQMVHDFCEAIAVTAELYRQNRLTYQRIVAAVA